jgi:hypothetical protein
MVLCHHSVIMMTGSLSWTNPDQHPKQTNCSFIVGVVNPLYGQLVLERSIFDYQHWE